MKKVVVIKKLYKFNARLLSAKQNTRRRPTKTAVSELMRQSLSKRTVRENLNETVEDISITNVVHTQTHNCTRQQRSIK